VINNNQNWTAGIDNRAQQRGSRMPLLFAPTIAAVGFSIRLWGTLSFN
jgi:hypothetical protein